jgi:GT2 family glycosyltransferase
LFNNSNKNFIESDVATKIVNSSTNVKLNGAYNYTLIHANKNNKSWILLLDQDTEITSDYFIKLSEVLGENKIEENTVAIIPSLSDNFNTLSPHKIVFFNSYRIFITKSGYLNGHITAFNSMSLIKVDFLNEISGFTSFFPLDMLDYWLYHQIYKHKKRVYLLDTVLNHSLSITDFNKNMQLERYNQLLQSENKYFSEFNFPHRLVYKTKLIYRTIKQLIFVSDKNFAKSTLKNIFKL